MKVTPKNKTGGVVSTTVWGVGALIVAIVISYVLITTVLNADLFADESDRSITATNEDNCYYQ